MKVVFSKTIDRTRPALEEQIWSIAVRCKEADPDIKLMGLHVSVRSTRPGHWCGHALPEEETMMLRPKGLLVHPAGRVSLSIGNRVSYLNIVRLVAHELRHIGQFHRGRKHYGYLTDEHLEECDVEPDAMNFEESILKTISRSSSRTYGGFEYAVEGAKALV